MIGWIIGGVGVAAVTWVIAGYNGFIWLKNKISELGQNIRNYSEQRETIVQKISTMVAETYSKHEKGTFKEVAEMRSKSKDAGKFMNFVVERYPKLKAIKAFSDLRVEISDIERDITDNKNILAESIKEWNVKVQAFPDNLLAGMFNFKSLDMRTVVENESKEN